MKSSCSKSTCIDKGFLSLSEKDNTVQSNLTIRQVNTKPDKLIGFWSNKIKSITLLTLAALFMLTQTGCFGSFGLLSTVYHFNAKAGNKWVKELVFLVFCAVPVYEIAGFVDIFILNFLEFWTGSNPIAMAPGQTETQQVQLNGKNFNLTATHNRFHLESLDKSIKQDLIYNDKSATWTVYANNKSLDICTYNPDGSVSVYKADKSISIYTADVLVKMAGNNTMALK